MHLLTHQRHDPHPAQQANDAAACKAPGDPVQGRPEVYDRRRPTALDVRLDLGGVVVAAGLEVGDVGVLVHQVGVVEQGGVSQHALLIWVQTRITRGVTPSCNGALGFRGVVWELEKRLATRAPFHCALAIRSKELYCE